MTALDATPHGIDRLAIRVGSMMESWGRERAARRVPLIDPVAANRHRAEVEAARAAREAGLTLTRMR